ncbi:MAG: hypothetical protein J6112_00130 [Clostridia bacterium]|nr:hypothetical protein [Clostridia bacterium]
MKKFIAILTVIGIIFSMSMLSSFASLQEDLPGNYNHPGSESALEMFASEIECIGSVISTVADASAVGIICPSWSNDIGSLTVTLWKWDTDYNTTKASEPLYGPTVFENFPDNSFIGFEFEETPLPAGVYFIELSEPADDMVGVWTMQKAYPGQLTFQEGEYLPKLSLRMQVNYVTPLEEGAVPYGELPSLEKPQLEIGGTGTDPYEVYFDFTKEDLSYFEGSGTVEFEVNEDGTLHVIVPEGAFDSQYSLVFSNVFDDVDLDTEIPCEKYPYVAIRMRICDNSYAPGAGEAFFYTTTIGGATGGYSAILGYDWSTTDWQTVIIDPTSNKQFIDNAKGGDSWLGFRFDVLNSTPSQEVTFDIAWIAFFENEEAALSFNGDFAAYEASKPTKEPTAPPTDTPAPTATPEVTEAPTDAPEVTDAPVNDPTEAPKATEAPANNGCGGFVGGIAALAGVALAAVLVVRKKEN